MENKVYYIKGELHFKSLTNKTTGQHERDTRECFRCSIKNPVFKGKNDLKEICKAYDIDDRFTPSWVKAYMNDKTEPEYLNFKSAYQLTTKVRDNDKNEVSIDADKIISGAVGYLKINVKIDGDSVAIYPSTFLMIENGHLKNSFDDIDF